VTADLTTDVTRSPPDPESVRPRVAWPSLNAGGNATAPGVSKGIRSQDYPEEARKSTHKHYNDQVTSLRYQLEQLQTSSQPPQSAYPSQSVGPVQSAQSTHSARPAQSRLPAQSTVHTQFAPSTLCSTQGTALHNPEALRGRPATVSTVVPTRDSQSQSRTNPTRRRHRARNDATGKKREYEFGPIEEHPTNKKLSIIPILNAGREGVCRRCKPKDQGCQHVFLFENGSDERIRSCRHCLGIEEGRLCGGPAGPTAAESAKRKAKDESLTQKRKARKAAEMEEQSQAAQANIVAELQGDTLNVTSAPE
jgi:hypothetical protein